MKIASNSVVQITYQVKLPDGVLVDEAPSDHPLIYLHGQGNLIPGLESSLEGKVAGDKFVITVLPNDGYGEYSEHLVQRVPKEMFEQDGEELEVGARFIAETDHGPHPVEITEIDGDEVVVDGNHMLAGETLEFSVEVLDVREATEEEIAYGDVAREHQHEHDGCCAGHGHDDKTEGCCGGHGHDDKTEGCCGGHGHADKTEGCCGGHGHADKTEGCCGGHGHKHEH